MLRQQLEEVRTLSKQQEDSLSIMEVDLKLRLQQRQDLESSVRAHQEEISALRALIQVRSDELKERDLQLREAVEMRDHVIDMGKKAEAETRRFVERNASLQAQLDKLKARR